MSIFDVFDRISANSNAARGNIEYVIAGLGNPGLEYENTRHNAGFDAIDCIAEKYGIPVQKEEGNLIQSKKDESGSFLDNVSSDLSQIKGRKVLQTQGGREAR